MPSCPANIRETKIAFGLKPQADLTTKNPDPELWSVTKTNSALGLIDLTTEDDSDDIGKGDEFPTTNYPTSASTGVPIEKYASSEFAAWTFLFALGKGTKTVTGAGFTYAAVPSDPAVECINVPPFTWVEQIRPQPDSVVDHALVGMVINDFTVNIESGPGRNNCRFSVNCIGTGQVDNPSGSTIPALTPEHMLNATAAAILTINGIDYKLGGNFISAEFKYTNNLRTDTGYYPGSGSQNGFATRGRMEYNKREFSLTFVARAQKGSIELANLLAQTPGSTTIQIKGAQLGLGAGFHQMEISGPRTLLSSYVTGEAAGIVTVNCTCKFMKPTDGVTPIVTLSAITEKDAIFGL